jgi:hypothetical protein
MKEPVDHILRPRLPWRAHDDVITECGYDAAKVKTLAPEDFRARLNDLGRQRTAMLTCMTCINATQKWGVWADDPRQAMSREIEWEIPWGRENKDHPQRLKDELLAIADLIEANRETFDAAVKARKDRQAWIDQKKEAEALRKRPKPRTPGGL